MQKTLSPSALGLAGHESEMLELALTFGFQAVEQDMAEFAGRVKLHDLAYAKRLLASARLPVGIFALPFRLDVEEVQFRRGLEKLREQGPLAVEVGCRTCVTTLAPGHETRPYHENFELHRQRLTEVCGVLEPAGIRLGVGFRGTVSARKGKALEFIHSLDALATLAKMVGAPNLGPVFDVWETFVSGGSVEELGGLSPAEIVAVYLSDLPDEVDPAAATERDRLLPRSAGRIPSAAALAGLAAGGYAGPVIPRAHPSQLRGLRRDQIAQRAAAALDALEREAGVGPAAKPLAATSTE